MDGSRGSATGTPSIATSRPAWSSRSSPARPRQNRFGGQRSLDIDAGCGEGLAGNAEIGSGNLALAGRLRQRNCAPSSPEGVSRRASGTDRAVEVCPNRWWFDAGPVRRAGFCQPCAGSPRTSSRWFNRLSLIRWSACRYESPSGLLVDVSHSELVPDSGTSCRGTRTPALASTAGRFGGSPPGVTSTPAVHAANPKRASSHGTPDPRQLRALCRGAIPGPDPPRRRSPSPCLTSEITSVASMRPPC